MIKDRIRYFNHKPVRAFWDNDKSTWWYSAVDFVSVLIEPNSPRRYWNNIKVRNSDLVPFCGQQKLYAEDGKQYLSDVINEEGVRLLLTIIPSKYQKAIHRQIEALLSSKEEQSKFKAYDFFVSELIEDKEIGQTIALRKIHAYLFEGLYSFAGKIRTTNISKGKFTFTNWDFLPQFLKNVDRMPDNSFFQIVDKYIEMNNGHPFIEGNGRATRIWLDLLLKARLKKCINWQKIEKDIYLDAMAASPTNPDPLCRVLSSALTDDINNLDIFREGINYSYYYEEKD